MEFPYLNLENKNQTAPGCKIKPTKFQVLEGEKPVLAWIILNKPQEKNNNENGQRRMEVKRSKKQSVKDSDHTLTTGSSVLGCTRKYQRLKQLPIFAKRQCTCQEQNYFTKPKSKD